MDGGDRIEFEAVVLKVSLKKSVVQVTLEAPAAPDKLPFLARMAAGSGVFVSLEDPQRSLPLHEGAGFNYPVADAPSDTQAGDQVTLDDLDDLGDGDGDWLPADDDSDGPGADAPPESRPTPGREHVVIGGVDKTLATWMRKADIGADDDDKPFTFWVRQFEDGLNCTVNEMPAVDRMRADGIDEYSMSGADAIRMLPVCDVAWAGTEQSA